MKRTMAVVGLLGLVATGAAIARQAAVRERDYRTLLGRGELALAEGKTFDAIEAYSGAIALRPDSMLAYLRRGETYQQREDVDSAARDFRTATALDPSATRPLEDLGDVNYRRERFSQAADVYAAELRLDDRSAPVFFKLALAHYRARNIDAALAALNQTLKLDENSADAYYLRGLCFREQRRLSQAVAALERAVAISPGMIAAREELAAAYAALGRSRDELEQLQLLAGLDREHVERQVAVGLAHARAGHWDLAVLTLGSALERAPDEPTIYCALGQVWLERPREKNDRINVGKAREALEQVASSPGATSEILTVYGRILAQDGEPERAEQTLQQAVTRFPVAPSAFLEYAGAAEGRGHLQAAREALVNYNALVDDDVTFASRAEHIGVLSLRMQDVPAALAWLQKAADAAPGDASVLAALAEAEHQAELQRTAAK